MISTMAAPSQLLPIDEALAIVADAANRLPTEPVALDDVYGRFLAEEMQAGIDLPPFVSSAMDGFAVRASDTPGELVIVGESAAGSPYAGTIESGQAIRISTGAVVPADADAVVPIEDVTVEGTRVRIPEPAPGDEFVRATGSDVHRGQPLLAPGTRIGPAQIGAAAAVGLRTLPCHRRPRVAILTTGSELRAAGETLADGEIYDANGPMLRAALQTAGAVVEQIPAAADTADAHRAALTRALAYDVVITSGGVSVGDHDLVRSVGAELGVRELFWRVALRPGKPLSFGVRGTTLLFGLPGNPVSTLVCFELFVRPALLAIQGARDFAPAFAPGVLGVPVRRNPARDDMIRVHVDRTRRPTVLTPAAGQQSHQIAITAGADALARIPAGTGEMAAGTDVDYLLLHRF